MVAGRSCTGLLRLVSLAVVSLGPWAGPLDAQIVRGSVLAQDSGKPVNGALVELRDSVGVRVGGAVTDAAGAFRIEAGRAGSYQLHVQRIGLESWVSENLRVEGDVSVVAEVSVAAVAVDDLLVRGESQCPGERTEVEQTYALLAEGLQRLQRVATTEYGRYLFQVRIEESLPDIPDPEHYNRYRLPADQQVLVTSPIATLAAQDLAEAGYIRPNEMGILHYYPLTSAAFVASEFQEAHCFEFVADDDERRVGIRFEPVRSRVEEGKADVEGVLWLDRRDSTLVALEYTYTGLEALLERYEVPRVYEEHRQRLDQDPRMEGYVLSFGSLHLIGTYGGRLGFDQVSDGSWITRSWELRIPLLGPGGQADWSRDPPRSAVRPVAVRIVKRGTVTGVARQQ